MAGERTAADGPPADDFTSVVNAHWTAVYRLGYRLTGHVHDAEEIAQETFTRALARWGSFAKGTNVRGWLLRIASNLFLDEDRKRRRHGVRPLTTETADPAALPGQALETREQAALVRAALEALSETTRLVFHLRVTEELAFREIGPVVGISEEAARWHMHQARVKLLARLGTAEMNRDDL